MIQKLLNWFTGGISSVLSKLPGSFINYYLTNNNFDFMGYLNWFIPFYDFKTITSYWLSAMLALFAAKFSMSLVTIFSKFVKSGE